MLRGFASSFRPLNSSFVRKWCYAASIVPESHHPHTRHSREGGNPRTNIPRKKANRDTTTCVHTATPLRLWYENRLHCRQSGSQTRLSSESWNPEGEGWGETDIPSRNRTASHDFHSLMRPPQGHGDSGEGRNPEGEGRGKPTRRWKKPTRHPAVFILSCGVRKAMVIPAKARIQGRGLGGASEPRMPLLAA